MKSIDNIIENVAYRLPNLPSPPSKNMFDILGVRNKETINSKVLAYFLNSDESHGFKELFFNSLMSIVKEKQYANSSFLDKFGSDFEIITEDTTNFAEEETNKRIDISIIGNNWGVIIENKLYHNLINPLKAYWQHTQKKCGDNIIGIILTLFPTKKQLKEVTVKGKKVTYLNITHKEWILEVQKQLYIGEINNVEGLFYLKEYIKTIESHYSSKMDEPTYNSLVVSLTKHRNEIQEIQKKIIEASRFIQQQIDEVFNTYGFEKENSWYTNKNLEYPFYFYVPKPSDMMRDNQFWFTFEIRNEENTNLRTIDKVKDIVPYFNKQFSQYNYLNIGGQSSKHFTHMATYVINNAIDDTTNFKKLLEEAFTSIFFKKDLSYVYMAQNFLKERL